MNRKAGKAAFQPRGRWFFMPGWRFAAVMALATTAFSSDVAHSQEIEPGAIIPTKELPEPVPVIEFDWGAVTSQGDSSGPYVRASDPSELAGRTLWSYPPFTDSPLSPAQASLRLLEGTPLSLIVPWGGSNGAPDYTRLVGMRTDGSDIFVDFENKFLALTTATIYGPTDRVYLLGPLPEGEYRLTLSTLTTKTEDWPQPFVLFGTDGSVSVGDSIRNTAFLEFTIYPVPEPSAVFSAVLAVAGLTAWRWFRRCCSKKVALP